MELIFSEVAVDNYIKMNHEVRMEFSIITTWLNYRRFASWKLSENQ